MYTEFECYFIEPVSSMINDLFCRSKMSKTTMPISQNPREMSSNVSFRYNQQSKTQRVFIYYYKWSRKVVNKK